jgi:hypothetical protein
MVAFSATHVLAFAVTLRARVTPILLSIFSDFFHALGLLLFGRGGGLGAGLWGGAGNSAHYFLSISWRQNGPSVTL